MPGWLQLVASFKIMVTIGFNKLVLFISGNPAEILHFLPAQIVLVQNLRVIPYIQTIRQDFAGFMKRRHTHAKILQNFKFSKI